MNSCTIYPSSSSNPQTPLRGLAAALTVIALLGAGCERRPADPLPPSDPPTVPTPSTGTTPATPTAPSMAPSVLPPASAASQ